MSSLAEAVGRQGLSAPGDNITGLATEGEPIVLGETSVAVPFVTGAIALLWSEFLTATATEVKLALALAHGQRRTKTVI